MIVEYEEKGSTIAYITDSGDIFVYPKDKFSSLEQVEAEIAKKTAWRAEKVKKDKKIKILEDLKVKDVKKKDKDVVLDA